MKAGIHPDYVDTKVTCTCGNEFMTRSTAKDGKIVWKTDLIKDLGGKLQNWGYTESVLIDGDKVICTPGGNDGTMAALETLKVITGAGQPLMSRLLIYDGLSATSRVVKLAAEPQCLVCGPKR